jgi:hypothetical protein
MPHRRPRTVTPLERVVGRRRARTLRHRVGWLAVGAGVQLLRPRLSRTAVAGRVGVGVLAAVGVVYVAGAVGAAVG